MKECELCKSPARMYCESDEASLCWECDGKVHSANFLVERHTRTLLCHACQSPTPWKASGAKLGQTMSVCEKCRTENLTVNQRRDQPESEKSENETDDDDEDEEEEEGDDDDDDDDDGDGDGDDGEDEDGEDNADDDDDDGDNQVVPWTSSTPPPPISTSSSSEDSLGRFTETVTALPLKRMRGNADLVFQDDRCFLPASKAAKDLKRSIVVTESSETVKSLKLFGQNMTVAGICKESTVVSGD